jgi:hypothetical protein
VKRQTVNPPQLRQLYALAHAISRRTNKKAIAKLWFQRAKALLSGEAGSREK